jgi:hypothetical protein
VRDWLHGANGRLRRLGALDTPAAIDPPQWGKGNMNGNGLQLYGCMAVMHEACPKKGQIVSARKREDAGGAVR